MASDRLNNKIKAFPDIDLRAFGKRSTGDPVFSDSRFYPYASGRAAVYAAARLLDDGSRRTVHMPAFHCGVEVEGFVRAGYEVRFYPVNESLIIDPAQLEGMDWKPGDILFVIHYFGFPQPMNELSKLCREHELVIVEDCAHALYSQTGTRLLGRYGDLAIFSMRKTIALPDGGGLLVNNTSLPMPPAGNRRLVPALFKSALRSALEYEARRGGLLSIPSRLVLGGHRGMTVSSGDDQVAECVAEGKLPDFYEDRRYAYDRALGRLSRQLLAARPVEHIVSRRRRNYTLLAEALAPCTALRPVFRQLADGTVPLCLPVWVDSSDGWMQTLTKLGVEGFVFGRHSHPLLPADSAGEHRRLRTGILGLPVHQDLASGDIVELAERISDAGGALTS